ncbi:spermidine/putrescine ABC transporter permease PotB [Paraglaciecola hydrolytica]|uniref:Spermidine/putrescine ABC transporter permease n=1 Tax=Paraglaciecola hydrolytica TaxID=1799789 RepID=A0A136A1A8_9ALTE|nr:spermidine/putrescine ABC transporter permease PotB [Paraglaciecola hydrolytica]KXI29019.1 spermidine/putrescine ABC transporter permease [Paraglaciecola hydrolytica]
MLSFRRLVIILTLSWMAIMVVVPHFLVLLTSFFTPDSQHLAVWPLTLDGYSKVFQAIYIDVFLSSLWLSAIATLICLLLGFPFAFILSKFSPTTRNILLVVMMLPFWTNSLIRTYAIKIILGKKGLINTGLLGAGIIDEPLNMLYTDFAVIFGLVYILLPFMVLPLISSFEKLSSELIEAAKDLRASAWQRLRYIYIPLTSPGIVAGCLIVFLPAMGMFYVADILGGATSLLLGNVIKNQFLVVRDWPFGSAFSVSLIIIMGLMLLLYYKANRYVQRQGGLDDESL